MNLAAEVVEILAGTRSPSRDGVIGFVNVLLDMCARQGLQFRLTASECRFCSVGSADEECVPVHWRRSAVRAFIARVAALCARPGEGPSPYGGCGAATRIVDGVARSYRVAYSNTSTEQWIVVTPNEASHLLVEHANGVAH